MPDLNDGEPIKYIEERQEHDETVLTKLDRHYNSICDSLKAMSELPINSDVSLPALRSAALFQKQIPDYLFTCNKHIRTITKARRAAADRRYGTAPPRQRLMAEPEETHMSRRRTAIEDTKAALLQAQQPTGKPPATTYPHGPRTHHMTHPNQLLTLLRFTNNKRLHNRSTPSAAMPKWIHTKPSTS